MSESTVRVNLQPQQLHASADNERGYTYAVQVGRTVWISGQVPKNRNGELVGGDDFEAQAVQVMENLKAIVAEAGGTMADVVKINTHLTDRKFRESVQRIRRRYFTAPNMPASCTVICELLVPGALLEIEATAVIGSAIRDAQ